MKSQGEKPSSLPNDWLVDCTPWHTPVVWPVLQYFFLHHCLFLFCNIIVGSLAVSSVRFDDCLTLFLQRTTLKLPVEVPRLGRIVLMLPHREALLQFGVHPMRIWKTEWGTRGDIACSSTSQNDIPKSTAVDLTNSEKPKNFSRLTCSFSRGRPIKQSPSAARTLRVTTNCQYNFSSCNPWQKAMLTPFPCAMSKPRYCKVLRWSTVPFRRWNSIVKNKWKEPGPLRIREVISTTLDLFHLSFSTTSCIAFSRTFWLPKTKTSAMKQKFNMEPKRNESTFKSTHRIGQNGYNPVNIKAGVQTRATESFDLRTLKGQKPMAQQETWRTAQTEKKQRRCSRAKNKA